MSDWRERRERIVAGLMPKFGSWQIGDLLDAARRLEKWIEWGDFNPEEGTAQAQGNSAGEPVRSGAQDATTGFLVTGAKDGVTATGPAEAQVWLGAGRQRDLMPEGSVDDIDNAEPVKRWTPALAAEIDAFRAATAPSWDEAAHTATAIEAARRMTDAVLPDRVLKHAAWNPVMQEWSAAAPEDFFLQGAYVPSPGDYRVQGTGHIACGLRPTRIFRETERPSLARCTFDTPGVGMHTLRLLTATADKHVAGLVYDPLPREAQRDPGDETQEQSGA